MGALGAALAVALVLPVTTHATTDAWIRRAVHCVHDCTRIAARRLAGDARAGPVPYAAELEVVLERVRTSVAPLVHLLNPLGARKACTREVLALLDECAEQVRGLVEAAADPGALHDDRLTAACRRVEDVVLGLVAPGGAPAAPAPRALPAAEADRRGAERALAHLHRLEAALTGLAAPLRSEPRPPWPVLPRTS